MRTRHGQGAVTAVVSLLSHVRKREGEALRSRWVRMRDGQGTVITSLSHVRVSEYEVWARHCCYCIIVIACEGRKGVVDMQTCAAGMDMSVNQQDHTCIHGIP